MAEARMAYALWGQWFDIAISHEHEARVARAEAVDRKTSGGNYAEPLAQELLAGLVAISATAHALDALYGQLITHEARDAGPNNDARREAHVRELLKRRFNTGPRNAAWVAEFRWLFDLRDAAVHARYTLLPTVPHPSGISYVGQVSRDYAAESVARAVDLVDDVLRTCLARPRFGDAGAVQWVENYRRAIEHYQARLIESRANVPLATYPSAE